MARGYPTNASLLWCVALASLLASCVAESNVNCTETGTCSELGEGIGICDEATGNCSCNTSLPEGCFKMNASTNLCVLEECAVILENSTEICRVGNYSRTTALCLSIFLINFGAANFYIRQFAFAIPQIVLGLLLCVVQFTSCGAAAAREDKTSPLCIICCSVNSVLSLSLFVWWIVDLVIFALNSRLDGNGCPLYT